MWSGTQDNWDRTSGSQKGQCRVVNAEDKEEEARFLERGRYFLGGYDKERGDTVKEIEMCYAFFYFYFSCCNSPMTPASYVAVWKKKKKFGFRTKFHQKFISDSLILVKRIFQQHNFFQPRSLLTDKLSYDIYLTSHPNISFTGTFTF